MRDILKIYLYTAILVLCGPLCVAAWGEYTHEDVVNLHNHLFQNYTPLHRPVKIQASQVQISFFMYLHSLQSYEVSTGDLTVLAGTILKWKDEFLSWNKSEYSDIEIIHIPTSLLWIPELVLLNSHVSNVVQENGFKIQSVSANGEIDYRSFGLMTTKCDTNVMDYPFDEHLCVFKYSPSSYTDLYVHLQTFISMIMITYTENEAWEIVNQSHSTGLQGAVNVYHSTVEFSFTIRRRPSFLLIHVFIPLLLIGWLNALTCFIPPDSGERVSFAATLFLSFSFVMASASEDLPKNSVTVSTFSVCLTVINILSVFGICWSVFIARVSRLGQEVTIPLWLKQLLVPSAYLFREKKDQTNESDEASHHVNSETGSINRQGPNHKPASCITGKIISQNKNVQQPLGNETGESANMAMAKMKQLTEVTVDEMSWANVASRLDKFYIVFNVSALICVTISFFAKVST